MFQHDAPESLSREKKTFRLQKMIKQHRKLRKFHSWLWLIKVIIFDYYKAPSGQSQLFLLKISLGLDANSIDRSSDNYSIVLAKLESI